MAATHEKLWGGTITDVSFDPAEWLLRMHVEVHHVDRTDEYLLTLTGIKQLTWTREVPLPWNYADLTELHLEGKAGDLTVECVVWNEPTGFVAHCEEMTVELRT